MARIRTGPIAALDVGSTKVSCFIALAGEDGSLRVAGVGHHASDGVKSGAIVDMDAAEAAVLAAVSAAESMAGEHIRSVVVNSSSGRPTSRTLGVEVSIGGQGVGDNDLRRVIAQGHIAHGQSQHNGDDMALIHCIPIGYAIDGQAGIREPRGMHGTRLGVDLHLVTASASAMRNLASCVARCHLDIEAAVVQPYASGLSCLVDDERELGVTVVDMGGGTTTLAVFHNGRALHTDWIPVGGLHVTGDIARGLSTPLVHAERMKTLYGNAIATPSDDREIIDVPMIGEETRAEPNHVPRSMLNRIIQPRLEETFEMVRERLESSGTARLAGRRLVLTGGASQLQGVRELAALIIEKQVRLGRPRHIDGLPDSVAGPAFATCAGLLTFAAETQDDARAWAQAPADGAFGRLGRLGQWLRENF